jgi:CMP/dCMP kinase
LKVFLTASAQVRAERRVKQIEARGQQADFQAIFSDLMARDKRDSERAVAPLKPCDDALVLDCSAMPIEQVLQTIHNWAKERI